MRILAIDTSTESCSVGLLNCGMYSSLTEVAPQQHAMLVLPMVKKLLSEQQLKLDQLDAFAVTIGPGSFTGVRIGVSLVQGLAFGVMKPVIPLSTLQVLAEGARRQSGLNHVVTGIDARMNEIYWAEYAYNISEQHWRLLEPEQLISPERASEKITELQLKRVNCAYAGSAWSYYKQIVLAKNSEMIASNIILPEVQDLLTLSKNVWQQQVGIINAQQLEPSYLRNNVVHPPKL